MLSKEKGFSLVELSIVLVVLGLLVGGVLTGRNLIRAAEIRSISADLNSYRIATYAFVDQYQALPGDLTNAVRYWGAAAGGTADGVDAACAALTHTSPAIGTETCNGNGNGQIAASYEMMRFWQHLSNAGLITGKYTGVTANSAWSDRAHTPGINCPASKFKPGGFGIYYQGYTDGLLWFFTGTYGNMFIFGGGPAGYEPYVGILTPEEAWNVDMKLDDGKPGTGAVRPRNINASGHLNCSTSSDPAVSTYNLSYTPAACGLYFITGL